MLLPSRKWVWHPCLRDTQLLIPLILSTTNGGEGSRCWRVDAGRVGGTAQPSTFIVNFRKERGRFLPACCRNHSSSRLQTGSSRDDHSKPSSSMALVWMRMSLVSSITWLTLRQNPLWSSSNPPHEELPMTQCPPGTPKETKPLVRGAGLCGKRALGNPLAVGRLRLMGSELTWGHSDPSVFFLQGSWEEEKWEHKERGRCLYRKWSVRLMLSQWQQLVSVSAASAWALHEQATHIWGVQECSACATYMVWHFVTNGTRNMWPWTTKPVLSSTVIFVAIAKNILYGSKW